MTIPQQKRKPPTAKIWMFVSFDVSCGESYSFFATKEEAATLIRESKLADIPYEFSSHEIELNKAGVLYFLQQNIA